MSKYGELFCTDLDYFQSSVPRRIDLMNLEPDDDAHDGVLTSVNRYAQEKLAGLTNEDLRALLGFSDLLVKEFFIDREAYVAGEADVRITRELLPRIRPSEIIPNLILPLEKISVSLGDTQGGQLLVTGLRVCCAYALTQVWHASIAFDDGSGYAIEAAKAQAMARMLSDSDSPLTILLAQRIGKEMGSAGGRKRWESDPKTAAMAEIEAEWRARKVAGLKFTAVSFAREMHKRDAYRVVTLEAIKNAQTRWNKKYHPAG